MNEHVIKGAIMALTTEELVLKSQEAYAKAEKALATARKELSKLPGYYAQIHANGDIGYLLSSVRAAAANAAAGRVADAELEVFQNHQADTAVAQEHGFDLIQPMSGGR
jgi:ketosteroid isomerase-like protein